MENRENSLGPFNGTYNKLTSHEDINIDEQPLYSNQEKHRVSMSMVRPDLDHYKVLTVSLAVLAVILLAVDIGLGVYYNKLTSGLHTITDISSEVARLQASYNYAVQGKDEAIKQLASETNEFQLTKWELEHQKKRGKDYEKEIEKINVAIAALKSHMPLIEEGCRHCLPGWTFMNSVCYFFAVSDALPRKSWQEARDFCKKQGGDLAIIETKEKLLAVYDLVYNNQDRSRQIGYNGFWIGLRDVEEEGNWKWLSGARLTEGFWNDGEPNNQGNEDCAAVYPRSNPFKAWNDAPCSFELRWICEMASRSTIS